MNLKELNTNNILVYSRRGIGNWSKQLADYLTFKGLKSATFSELRFGSDYSLLDSFNEKMNSCEMLFYYDDKELDDIICRCRLLRSLEREIAIKMINAMVYSVNSLFDLFIPKIIVSLRIDSYVLDIIERESRKRGIIFLGIWKSAFKKGYFFITSRGELNYLQSKYDNVIRLKDIITEDFKAVSIVNKNNYGYFKSFKVKLYYIFRSYYLLLMRFILRDKFGYRYLTNSLIVKEYKVNLFENNYNKFIKADWNLLLQSNEKSKNIFIALQVNPESTIDYYVKDIKLINYEAVLVDFINQFYDSEYTIFIKDHPNMYGRRSFTFFEKILSYKNVRYIPYNIDSTYILKFVNTVFTWSGTISIQAALSKKIAVVVNPPYYIEDVFIQIKQKSDIYNVINSIDNYDFSKLTDKKINELLNLINSSLYKGDLDFKNIDTNLFDSLYKIIIKNEMHNL